MKSFLTLIWILTALLLGSITDYTLPGTPWDVPPPKEIVYPDIAYDACIKLPHKISRKYLTSGRKP